jgi:hypothetical protein
MPIADLPQSNRQHAVPQNIMDVEFKIVGDLTMRQFTYLFVFGLGAYFSSVTVPGLFRWPITLTLGLLALGLAFIPVQERGLDEWLVNFFRSINSPTQRIWKKEPQIPTAFMYDNLAVVKQEMITLAPTSSRRKLEEYLRRGIVDQNEDPLDIPEKAYAMKVRQAYPEVPRSTVAGVGLEEPLVEQEYYQEPEPSEQPEQSEFEPGEKKEGDSVEKSKEVKLEEPNIVRKKEPSISPKSKTGPKVSPKKRELSIIRPRSAYSKSAYRDLRRSSMDYETDFSQRRSSGFSSHDGYSVITPDMHSGRKFVNLVPSDGEIILPIRGEKFIDTKDDSLLDRDLDEKAKKLNELLDKIRTQEDISVKEKPEPVRKSGEQVDKKAGEVAVELKKQNENLSSEIERLKEQISRNKSMSLETGDQERLLKKLESQKTEIASSYSELRSQVQDLQKKLQEKEQVSTGDKFIEKTKKQLPVLTGTPNVVSGVVRDSDGKFFSDCLLIIKNSRGDTVRAFKTNSLGQFVVSTPLDNGTYTVEVSPSNKTNLSFGIIPVEVKGGVIPTLDIVGK